jgi:hypothetical protein
MLRTKNGARRDNNHSRGAGWEANRTRAMNSFSTMLNALGDEEHRFMLGGGGAQLLDELTVAFGDGNGDGDGDGDGSRWGGGDDEEGEEDEADWEGGVEDNEEAEEQPAVGPVDDSVGGRVRVLISLNTGCTIRFHISGTSTVMQVSGLQV